MRTPLAPAEALAAVAAHPNRPLILDLDLTLVLAPTTDAFLNDVLPASLAAVALGIVDKLQPWRILPGGRDNRDWVRAIGVAVLLPWSLPRWRRRSRAWAAAHRNDALVTAACEHPGPVVVVTRGFDAIVRPVVSALGDFEVVSCRLWRWRGHRQRSKIDALGDAGRDAIIDDAIAVTDSEDDAELLDRVAVPVLAEWPGAEWIDPLADAYRPMRYVTNTKEPVGMWPRYAWYRGDLIVVLLGYFAFDTGYLAHAVGLTLLSFGLWTLYEAGYHENDVRGAKFESDPVLPANFDQFAGTVPPVAPWVWAAGFALAAAALFSVGTSGAAIGGPGATTFVGLAVRSMASITFVRVAFGLFNRLSKPHRVLPHLVLQVGKYLGFVLVTAVTPVGLVALAAHALGRWVPYAIYRWHHSKTFTERTGMLRLAMFVPAGAVLLVFDHTWRQVALTAVIAAYYAKTAR